MRWASGRRIWAAELPLTLRLTGPAGQLRRLFPGLLACATVAAAAGFRSAHHAAPVMLFALLLGLAMSFMSAHPACQPGIEFASKQVLRLGVSLLGLRITADQLVALGWQPVLLVVAAVAATIAAGIAAAKLMGSRGLFGLLTDGAVAICGASAALALPSHPQKERARCSR